MSPSSLLFLVFSLALAAWYFGQQRALLFRRQTRLHSQPRYHGAYVALWCGLPALLVLLLWTAMGPGVIDSTLAQQFSGKSGNVSASDIGLMLNEVKNLAARGQLETAEPGVQELARQYLRLQSSSRLYQTMLVVVIALAGGFWASSRLSAEYRTRNAVEKTVHYLLMGASIIAILTTIGIVMSVLFESIRFFKSVPISEFLFGLHWSPQTAIRADQVAASGSFGAIPLLAGTFLIAFIALCVAIPFGLMSAIYLSEYATPRFRGLAKPMLEILAGVPTVVYGFFAALTRPVYSFNG
jgi:phosphate transport system permease protein